MSEHVVVERRGPIQTIRMNRPNKKNAITRAMYAAMAAALKETDGDDALRCTVIMGVPGAFSSGNDIADFLAFATGGALGTEVLDFLAAMAGTVKPLVAAVDGLAIGIGTTINFHTDLTFATARSVFRTPFVDLGLVPEAGSSLLAPRLMGHQRAFALLGLSHSMTAQEAKDAGFVYRITGEDEVEAEALHAAEMLAQKPPEALRLARDLMRGPRADVTARIAEEAKLFGERLKSDEARAAFIAFMAKKK
jgi:enoyl-CoA hydratase/carnithine racemase